MKNKSLISINDYCKEDITKVLDLAEEFEKNPNQSLLENKVIGTLFFEPSTRTRLSFESAVNRLNGRIIGFASKDSSSVQKGESLKDTIKTVNNYCDLIVMRHPLEGSARFASEVVDIPVVNAGDGANQHPTQALLDLYSIQKTQGRLDKLKIGLAGDLRFGRTVHSLAQAMSKYQAEFKFISPKFLQMPQYIKEDLDEKKIKYSEFLEMEGNIDDLDILYVTRIQKERFADPEDYERVKGSYVLKKSMLSNVRENFRVLHPLPRVDEIATDVDDTRY